MSIFSSAGAGASAAGGRVLSGITGKIVTAAGVAVTAAGMAEVLVLIR